MPSSNLKEAQQWGIDGQEPLSAVNPAPEVDDSDDDTLEDVDDTDDADDAELSDGSTDTLYCLPKLLRSDLLLKLISSSGRKCRLLAYPRMIRKRTSRRLRSSLGFGQSGKRTSIRDSVGQKCLNRTPRILERLRNHHDPLCAALRQIGVQSSLLSSWLL